ncbi:hypothetical protein ABZS53_15280 [Streptomyces sp. NPDC005499]|uniref:hypothetical protein n=1 Tax=Streptomyces sp. NPDC005499 TaxID=3154883 RepID=UPI0033B43EEA
MGRFHKLLDEVNHLEGYDPTAPKLPPVLPFCRRHRLQYESEPTLDGLLVCLGCVAEADDRRRAPLAVT